MGEEVREFIIPLEKDELLASRAGLYNVEEITPATGLLRALDATRIVLQNDGPPFILDHFDTFFSVLVHGHKLELSVTLKAFERILKAIDRLIGEMDEIFDRGGEIRPEERPQYLNINKMYAYLLSSLSCYIEDYINKQISKDMDSIGKKKKSVQKSDAEEHWEASRQKALECIYRWLQLPLQKLWSPPIVDDLFITVLAQFCYKVLEQNRDARQIQLRETIFQILGTLVKNYNHGITSVIRIIQLVKLYDALAAPLAAGVVHMVTDAGCPGFIKEMVREIGHGEPGEADARNISTFLESIASAKPDFILPILDNLTEYLANDCYTMRNCALGVIGSVVIGTLTVEGMDDERREKRDECLSMLEEHFLDSNAYVRSKVLQVWQRLCCNGAIPLAKQGSVLKATALRLEDKSANVRKQALQLLRALLQGNPFAARLNKEKFTKQLEEAKAKLKELKVLVASLSTAGGDERTELWNALLPEIRKALTRITADEKDDDDDQNSSSDEEPEEAAEAPQFVADDEFEKVRQLLLTEEVFEAVTYLKKICKSLPGYPDMSDMSKKEKEDSLFIFLLKIFKESERIEEEGSATARQNDANSQETNETTSKKEFKKRKEELRQQRALVNYIEYCLEFARELENVIPIAKTMLFSTMAGDAVEACSFLGTACQFEVPNALAGVRESLFQVFSRDQSVRNNVAAVYKEIYLASKEANQGARQKAITTVNGLLNLLRGLAPGQSPALCQLVGAWRLDGELGDYELQIMWEKFSLKIPVDHPEDSRAALMLLTMAADKEPSLFTANLEVLMKVGFGKRAKIDLLLARDTCRALMKIKQDPGNPEKQPIRYMNDHVMFEEIITLVVDNFTSVNDNGYISFVHDAINVIYHLANQPDTLIKRVLLEISQRGHFFANENEAEEAPEPSQPSGPPFYLLSRLLYIVGHIAIREMVHLDNGVYKELKRRNTVREIKKGEKGKKNAPKPNGNPASTPMNASRNNVETPASARQTLRNKRVNNTVNEDNGEETLEGAVADDADAEFVTAALENDILAGDGILAKFIPLVLDVCRNPEKYSDEELQVWGVLALSKMMTISSIFCVDNLQLLVTIMERSANPKIRANVVVGLCDLTTRFPNQVEPWTSHIYGRLRDDNVQVRSTCVRMLSSLIMREMIRVKGQVSGLALCIIDSEPQIRSNTKQFFKDLSCKGNALYNVMPDIISRLTDPELNLKEDEFQEIIKYILGLLQKERQIDTIIDKLCSRFKLATMERQWRDLSYCLSLLQFNAKSIQRLIQSLPLLKEKIHHKQVLKSLHTIIDVTKRKPDAKAACVELEEKIEQMLNVDEEVNGPIDDRLAMPPPPVPKQKKPKRKSKPRRDSSSEEDDDEDDQEDSDSDNNQMHNVTGRPSFIRKKASQNAKSSGRERISNSDSDSDEEAEAPKQTSRTLVRATPARSSGKRKKESAESPAPSPSRPQPKKNKQLLEPAASTSGTTTPRRSSTRVAKKNR